MNTPRITPWRRPGAALVAIVIAVLSAAAAAQIGNPGTPPDCLSRPVAWEVLQGVGLTEHAQAIYKFQSEGYRPLCISVNVTTDGQNASDRWSSVWIKDGRKVDWYTNHEYDHAELTIEIEKRAKKGYYPIAIDAYQDIFSSDPADVKYVAIWVKDRSMQWKEIHGITQGTLQAGLDAMPAGWRPLWISGHEEFGDGLGPRFAAIAVKDGGEGRADLGLEKDDLTDGVAQKRTDAGYRLHHLSGYDTPEGRRYAATWVKQTTSCTTKWEAFPAEGYEATLVKTISQYPLTAAKTLVPNAPLDVVQGEMATKDFVVPHLHARTARIRLASPSQVPATLSRITMSSGSGFVDGDLLVLEPQHGDRIVLSEDGALAPFQGRIRLRPWRGYDLAIDRIAMAQGFTPNANGQPFVMDSYHHQIVLRYHGDSDTWFEVQRNGVSHGAGHPISIDEHGTQSNDPYGDEGRDLATVWIEVDPERSFRVRDLAARPAGQADLDDFDAMMREYMMDRNIPGGALGIAVDGELKFCRAYTWEPSQTADVMPDDSFRLGSISKSITSAAIMKLVDDGLLDPATRLVNVPGVDSVINSSAWLDQWEIEHVTIYEMLHHIGGFTRSALGNAWEICSELNLGHVPVSFSEYVAHFAHDWNGPGQDSIHTITHIPGTHYRYSNTGYRLLALPIAMTSGTDCGSWVMQSLFDPISTSATFYQDPPGGTFGLTYFTPNNTMLASRVPWAPYYDHPIRSVCEESHWDQALETERGPIVADEPNAAGAWYSSAIDMTRFLSAIRNDELISESAKRRMLALPVRRSTKVIYHDAAQGTDTDLSLEARDLPGFPSIAAPLAAGDWLYFGKGYKPFGEIEIELAGSGFGYTLVFEYFDTTQTWVPLTIDDDETAGLLQSGSVRFQAPDDWMPRGVGSSSSLRYYVRCRSLTAPAISARIAKVDLGSETGYAKGWVVSKLYESELRIDSVAQPFSIGDLVIGADSRASATVEDVLPGPGGTTNLIIEDLRGGPFEPGEALSSPSGAHAFAVDRDWPVRATVWHDGGYAGCHTELRAREDGVDFIWMFNWSREEAFYYRSAMRNGKSLTTNVDDKIDVIQNAASWPAGNLFTP